MPEPGDVHKPMSTVDRRHQVTPDKDGFRSIQRAFTEGGFMRDPTRGGVATALNEIAQQSGVWFAIEEHSIPVRPAVQAACELLGLDPLVANEGKLIAIVAPDAADMLLAAMRAHPSGATPRSLAT